MPATIDIADLLDIEKWIEEGFKGFLAARGFSVFTRLNSVEDFQKVRPRVEIRSVLGSQNGHKALCIDFEERNDQWAITVIFQVVTAPENKPEDNVLHGTMRGSLRAAMTTAAQKTFNDIVNFPYHVITEALIESGSVPVLKEDDGLEYSTVSFNGVVAIRDIQGVGSAYNLTVA